ncbi:MAG: hypothetical protein ACREI8_03775 [Myxococcota bacterium]
MVGLATRLVDGVDQLNQELAVQGTGGRRALGDALEEAREALARGAAGLARRLDVEEELLRGLVGELAEQLPFEAKWLTKVFCATSARADVGNLGRVNAARGEERDRRREHSPA